MMDKLFPQFVSWDNLETNSDQWGAEMRRVIVFRRYWPFLFAFAVVAGVNGLCPFAHL